MKDQLTSKDIVAGCLKGQVACQKELVRRFSGLLFAVCVRYTGDEHKAHDVLQDTFIKVFKSIHTFDDRKGRLVTWMRRIAVNTALKQLDKKKLDATSTLAVDFNEKYAIPPSVLKKLNADDLMDLVRQLPEGYRQVFNMYAIEGYAHKEIAAILNIKEVSSRSNLSRARQILKQQILSQEKYKPWAKII